MDLKEGTLYIIRFKHDKKRIFVGTFKCFVNTHNKMNANFTNVATHYSNYISDELSFYNYTDYNYYDVYKLNNAKKARHDMEKRALDMVLKRTVNEHFEW
jgi:hypothetical protein